MSGAALSLAAVIGIGLYYISRSPKPSPQPPQPPKPPKPVPNVDYRTIFYDDDPNDHEQRSYSHLAIADKLVEEKFEIIRNGGKWIFSNPALFRSEAHVNHVVSAITQYRNGQFYWNGSGRPVDWHAPDDRKHIIELLRYG